TGQVPFPREGEAARLYAHLNDPPPAPSLYAPGTPMALDDVVVRAMSKQPGDRYPSAGDLGRAALAAVSGESISIPERTVATGAATIEPETVAPADPTTETEPGATDVDFERPIDPPKSTAVNWGPPGEGAGGGARRAWAVAGGGLAVVAAVVLAIVLFSGGGGGGDATSGGDTTTAQTDGTGTTGSKAAKQEKKAQPQTLTTS